MDMWEGRGTLTSTVKFFTIVSLALCIRLPLKEINSRDDFEQFELTVIIFYMIFLNNQTIKIELRSSLTYRFSFKVLFVPVA